MKKILTLTLLFATSAHAKVYDYSKQLGFGGAYGYNTPVFGNMANELTDGDETWDIHLRYHLNQRNGLELTHTRHELTDTSFIPQVTDLIFFQRLRPLERFSPTYGIGLGIVDIVHHPEESWKLGAKFRGGLEYAITPWISTGINVDYQHINKMLLSDNLDTRNAHLLAGRVSLTWYFRGTEQ